jgi:hypothetical protein
MKTQRWLLPFTHAVDMQAIDVAMRVANHGGATLVALSLITPKPGRRAPSVRLEQLQESKDFLEAVRWKAVRSQAVVELREVMTDDVAGSIATQVQKLDCQCVLLMGRDGRKNRGPQGTLLEASVLKQVLMKPPASLLVLTLPAASDHLPLLSQFLGWLHHALGRQEEEKRGPTEWDGTELRVSRTKERQRV